MRSDMQKLICERPRSGHSNPSIKTGKKLDPGIEEFDDLDVGPKRMSTSRMRNWEHKTLNENLKPLERFLESCVGRPWDKVYSEIRANLDMRKAIGLHVLQHLKHMVWKDIYIQNGKPYSISSRYYQQHEIDGLYVHPKTGILSQNLPRKYGRVKEKPEKIKWFDETYFELVKFEDPAIFCHCVRFKYFDATYRPSFKAARRACVHGREPQIRKLWYVVEYGYHHPDEVYQVIHFGHWRAKDYNLKEGERKVLYYRDYPTELSTPFEIKRKVCNKKELAILHSMLE